MAQKVLDILIRAKDAASKIIRGTGDAAVETDKKVVAEQEKTSGGFFQRLAQNARKNQLERRQGGQSALENALSSGQGITSLATESLGIAVPALILDKVGDLLANVTGKIVEMREALQQGKANWADYSLGVLQSIRIIGKFAEAGANINELFTHNKEKIKENEFAANADNAFSDITKKRSDDFRKLREQMGHEETDINFKLKLIGVRGFEADQLRVAKEGQDAIDAIQEKAFATKKQRTEENNADIANLNKLYAAATNDAERSDIIEKKNRIAKEQGTELAAIDAHTDEMINAQQAATYNQQIVMQQEHFRELNKTLDTYDDQIEDSYNATNQTILRANRQFYAAELQNLTDQNNQKKRVLYDQLQQQLHDNPENHAELNQRYEQLKKQLDDQTAVTKAASEYTTIQYASLALMKMAGDAGNDQWKVQGEINSRLREENDLREKLRVIAADENSDQRENAKLELKQLDQNDKDRVANNLREAAKKALDVQAQYGATASQRESARREGERQKLIDSTRQAAEAANQILLDPAATAAQKQTAIANAKAIAEATGRQYQQDIYGHQDSQSVIQATEAQQLHGLSEAAEEKDDRINEQISLTQETRDLTKQMVDYLGRILGNGVVLTSS